MNLKQFQYVLVLAQEGSFSKAAEALSIKQPSLSQYVKKIEQDMGMQLFDRNAGNVKLTDAGRAYIDVGRKMLDLEHQLEERFSDISANKSGTVTIGIASHRSVALMPEIVSEFQKLYPGIILVIKEKKRGEIIDAACHGEFDLCLTTLPVDEKQFCYETVLVEENVIAVPKGIVLQTEQMKDRLFPAISAKELNGKSFAMLNEEHLMQKELEKLCTENNISLNKKVVCTSLDALLQMVKIGVGAAFIPSCMAKKSQDVTYYSVKEETSHREIILMHRKEQYLSQVVIDLMKLIKDVFERKTY